jgi:cytochrome P450
VVPVVFLIHRDQRIWKDPDKFMPERFTAGGEVELVHPFAYFPFSAGSRACIGAGLAPLVMQKVLTMVLRRFNVQYNQSEGQPSIDFGFGIPPRGPVIARISRKGD